MQNWYHKAVKLANKAVNKANSCQNGSCNTLLGKLAQQRKKKPYYAVRIGRGNETRLKYPSIFAYSPLQARRFFFNKYPSLRDYLDAGFDIEVVLDREKAQEIKEQDAEYQQAKTKEQEKRDELIQDAWWNK